jgi:hypothetical protein
MQHSEARETLDVAAAMPRVKLRETPWTRENGGGTWQPCPCCNKRWRPFVGSFLPCHARCLYEPATAATIKALYLSTSLTEKQLADALGIAVPMLRAICRERR